MSIGSGRFDRGAPKLPNSPVLFKRSSLKLRYLFFGYKEDKSTNLGHENGSFLQKALITRPWICIT